MLFPEKIVNYSRKWNSIFSRNLFKSSSRRNIFKSNPLERLISNEFYILKNIALESLLLNNRIDNTMLPFNNFSQFILKQTRVERNCIHGNKSVYRNARINREEKRRSKSVIT